MRLVYYTYGSTDKRRWEHMFDIYTNQTIEQYVLCNPMDCYAMPEGDYVVTQAKELKTARLYVHIKVTQHSNRAKVLHITPMKDDRTIWILLVQSYKVTGTRITDPRGMLSI